MLIGFSHSHFNMVELPLKALYDFCAFGRPDICDNTLSQETEVNDYRCDLIVFRTVSGGSGGPFFFPFVIFLSSF